MMRLEEAQTTEPPTVTIPTWEYKVLIQHSHAYGLMEREVIDLLRARQDYSISPLQKALFAAAIHNEKVRTNSNKEEDNE